MRYTIPSLLLILSLIWQGCGEESKTGTSLVGFDPMDHPVSGDNGMPRLFSDRDTLYLSWVEQLADTAALRVSKWSEGTWSEPVTLASGTDWFVNWADFPQVAVNQGNLLATYLQKSDTATFAYDIHYVLRSADGSILRRKLHTDTTRTEHGFVSVVPGDDGSFFLSWLDGRNTGGGSGHQHHGAMTLRGGVLSPQGTLSDSELDARVCDCCSTTATAIPGGVLVAYRDRSPEEVRDIGVIRNLEGSWSDSRIVNEDNWVIPGCPVNGPSVDAWNSRVALAWFTAAGDDPRVMLALSADAGASFGPPIRLDSGNATGRVAVTWIGEDELAVIWMEPRGQDEFLICNRVSAKGEVLQEYVIAEISPERASGFPQLQKAGSYLLAAWTEAGESTSSIKLARLAL